MVMSMLQNIFARSTRMMIDYIRGVARFEMVRIEKLLSVHEQNDMYIAMLFCLLFVAPFVE